MAAKVRDRSPGVLKDGRWEKDSNGIMRWVPRQKRDNRVVKGHDPRGMPWCSCTPLLSTITRQKEVQNG